MKCLPCFSFVATGSCDYRDRCQYIHDCRIMKRYDPNEIPRKKFNKCKNSKLMYNDKTFFWNYDETSTLMYNPDINSDKYSYYIWKTFIEDIQ